MQIKMRCSAIDFDSGEVTYTLADVEEVVNFEIGQMIEIPAQTAFRASLEREIDAMNKAWHEQQALLMSGYLVSKEELAVQYPEYEETYDDLLTELSDWDTGDTYTIECANRAVEDDEELQGLLYEVANAEARVAAHCRKKLEERAKPSLSPATACEVVTQLLSDGAIDKAQARELLDTPVCCSSCGKTNEYQTSPWTCYECRNA